MESTPLRNSITAGNSLVSTSNIISPSHLESPSSKGRSRAGECIETWIEGIDENAEEETTFYESCRDFSHSKKSTKTVHFQSPDASTRSQGSDQGFLSPSNNAIPSPQYQPMAQEQGINKSVQDTRPAQVDGGNVDIPTSSAQTGSSSSAPNKTVLETVKNIATAPSMEELKIQLAEARAQIAGMSSEGGLRMRKAANAVGVEDVIPATQAAMNTVRSEGVPVHYTALLCLLSFLIAYFFF